MQPIKLTRYLWVFWTTSNLAWASFEERRQLPTLDPESREENALASLRRTDKSFELNGSVSVPVNMLLLNCVIEGMIALLLGMSCSRKTVPPWFIRFIACFVLLVPNCAIIHVYDNSVAHVDAKHSTDKPLYGLNVPKEKFSCWVGYIVGGKHRIRNNAIKTRLYFVYNRSQWRKGIEEIWRESCLLGKSTPHSVIQQPKDLLNHFGGLYIKILEDELEDDRDHTKLMAFLRTEYGPNITKLEALTWNKESYDTQLQVMQDFLDWFRSMFPYYYDKCDACGASSSSSLSKQVQILGFSGPNIDEAIIGKATNVEFYHCLKCGAVTRFARFNSAMSICESRRGRCGEYNLLLLRMLQALGHTCRFVSDCGNGHVWSEVQWDDTTGTGNSTNRRWLHLDPCEAAVNKNLLYKGWGRNLQSVFAFCAPPFVSSDLNGRGGMIPIIEDVVDQYKSKRSWFRWRQKTVDEASVVLRDKILELHRHGIFDSAKFPIQDNQINLTDGRSL